MQSNEFVDIINRTWPQVGKTFVIFAVIAAVMAVIIIAIIETVKSIIKKEKDEEDTLSNFHKIAKQKGLNSNAEELLKSMLQNIHIENFDSVFESISIFEECVETEIIRLQDQDVSSNTIYDQMHIIGMIREKLGFSNLDTDRIITSSRQFTPGQKLYILPSDKKNAKEFEVTIAVVNELKISVKSNDIGGRTSGLKIGDRIDVHLNRSDAVYSFTSILTENVSETSGIFGFEHAKNLQRRQNRNNVRLDTKVAINYRVLQSEEKNYSTERQKAIMQDISGGGTSFIQDYALNIGDVISLSFDLTTGKFRGIAGKIIRISEVKAKEDAVMFRHHIQFIRIEKADSDKIVKYIFEKQREDNLWR